MPHTHHQTAHLIYGPTAAGKSTLAQQMAAQINGVRFAIDEWMHAMFAEDMPDALEMRWVMSRVARCQNHIWSVAAQVLATGTDVVLELGLLRKSDRAAIKARVELAGHKAVFHFVDADVEVRRARVLRRNAERGATYSLISRQPCSKPWNGVSNGQPLKRLYKHEYKHRNVWHP